MKAPLFLSLCATVLLAPPLQAQDIPGETVGDTGWIALGQDTLILVRASDGNVWLQQNLGAAEVANASNGANAYGSLYQWGRWDDGHALPGSATAQASTLTENDPIGLGTGSPFFYIGTNPTDWWSVGAGTDTWSGSSATATNGIDPCSAFGAGWQLPAKEDWIEVLAAEGISNTATALASNLHMPAAGARDGQMGPTINVGSVGQYWSSTASGPYAKDLTVGDTWVNADDDALRSYGMCVRCLNKELHVGLRENSGEPMPVLFPNPSDGRFTVESRDRIERIALYSADLRLIDTWYPAARSAPVTLEPAENGLYWVCVSSANGVHWQPLIVAR